jgi:hypothetical protein
MAYFQELLYSFQASTAIAVMALGHSCVPQKICLDLAGEGNSCSDYLPQYTNCLHSIRNEALVSLQAKRP